MLKRSTKSSKAPQVKQPKVKAKKPKLKTLPTLEKQLWKLFSVAVRLRDSNNNGFCKCITCENVVPYFGTSTCHAGHFRSRNERSIKYEFKNVHAQCAYCNAYKNGEQYKYGIILDQRYGPGTADLLTQQGKRVTKTTRDFIEEKTIECYEIIRKNATEKNLWDWKSLFTKTELNLILDGM